MSSTIERGDVLGVNVIFLSDGQQIRIADIQTVEEGRTVLDSLTGGILGIEAQIERMDISDPDYSQRRRRAERALRIKRLQRPRLEVRIAEIRRAERAVRAALNPPVLESQTLNRRRAFVQAAQQILGEARCQEIWTRARENHPEAWSPAEGKP
ncbi:hypothetical protein [Methylobacterium sp. J-090]|uniref:hypothetical protein n=1 Tax=Methylobacterium sp. J-090 TaxID=2836666 RepID=UPI001FB9F87E|nr:hypothetical protein [Methylobacterium sp. J-090]MCJ2080721.1 hypothetical protein [Methylobacterium sp. J-090]